MDDAQLLSPTHHDTKSLVYGFSKALGDKLARAEIKYGYSNGWATDDWEEQCRRDLRSHVDKGDPLDVAAYAAFCWARGWSTAEPLPVVTPARMADGDFRAMAAAIAGTLAAAQAYRDALQKVADPAPGQDPADHEAALNEAQTALLRAAEALPVTHDWRAEQVSR